MFQTVAGRSNYFRHMGLWWMVNRSDGGNCKGRRRRQPHVRLKRKLEEEEEKEEAAKK